MISGETTANGDDPFYLTLNHSVLNQEDLNIRLNLDISGTNHSIYLPIEVDGTDINITGYDTDDHNVAIGEINEINIGIKI